MAETLRTLVTTCPPETVQAALAPWAEPLAQLAAEVGTVAHQPLAPPALDAELARRRLFEAIAGFLCSIAEPVPQLVVLDDLHLAGESTFELLHFLLTRRAAGLRLLVVATSLPGAPASRLHEALDDVAEVITVGRSHAPSLRTSPPGSASPSTSTTSGTSPPATSAPRPKRCGRSPPGPA